MDRPIRTIIIAGDGIVAWSAAAAIRRRLPMISVTVVPAAASPAALADRSRCTLPSIMEFHEDIRLGNSDVMVRAGSQLRLGARFEGWGGAEPDYVHAYGDHGAPLGAAPFHQHWLRAKQSGRAASFDRYSVSAQMARAGRFASPEAAARVRAGRFAFGLYIDPVRYREIMRAYALSLGAGTTSGELAGVDLDSHHRIASLQLEDGNTISGDLFVDATGPDSRLRSSLGGEWQDWGKWLVADRVILGEAEAASPHLADTVTALPGGWMWTCSPRDATFAGLVYSSHHLDDGVAAELLNATVEGIRFEEPVHLKQGRWAEPWLGNCVAIGDAAAAVEPLESTNLHLAFSAIDRLIASMPDSACSPIELWDYNRQATAEIDRVRDFLIMHYLVSNRPTDAFWKDASSVEAPPSLRHTLSQFRERGRLPYYEEETFSRDSWLAVLLGQGVIPRRIDPLVDSVPREQSESAVETIERNISLFVQSLPPYAQFLEGLKQKVA